MYCRLHVRYALAPVRLCIETWPVRFFAGYIDPDNREPGGSWDSGYQTTAFFLVWLEDAFPWFLHGFNQSFDTAGADPWSWGVLEILTGEPVEELWQAYQDDIVDGVREGDGEGGPGS